MWESTARVGNCAKLVFPLRNDDVVVCAEPVLGLSALSQAWPLQVGSVRWGFSAVVKMGGIMGGVGVCVWCKNKNIARTVGDGRGTSRWWFEKERSGFRRKHRGAQYRRVSVELGLGCRSFLDVDCYTSLLLDLGASLHLFYEELEMVKERSYP